MDKNLILSTDSYKASHFLQLPEGLDYASAYISARGTASYHKAVRFFGLQYLLKAYFTPRITQDNVEEAEALLSVHGEPFNRQGWERIVLDFDGQLPLRIRALPEGLMTPLDIPLVVVENTAPGFGWLPAYVESILLKVWYPTTVATNSHAIREIIRQYLEDTADDVSSLEFKLHDFGFRGVSSEESAGIGGLAHLLNFKGTDTVPALRYGRAFYNEPMAGFSIPASEHFTITSWGRENEFDAYRNMVERFGGKGRVYACVADSYDLYRAITEGFGGELREEIVRKGGTLVIRPDSGQPETVSVESARRLDAAFGSTVNRKGYKVLNNVRVIYGDGINEATIRGILLGLKLAGYSADNIAFGMGGALLQNVSRDDFSFAMKTSAVWVNGAWRDVYKAPVTDSAKRSKRGRQTTLLQPETGEYLSHVEGQPLPEGWVPALRTVFENGRLLVDESLADIRSR